MKHAWLLLCIVLKHCLIENNDGTEENARDNTPGRRSRQLMFIDVNPGYSDFILHIHWRRVFNVYEYLHDVPQSKIESSHGQYHLPPLSITAIFIALSSSASAVCSKIGRVHSPSSPSTLCGASEKTIRSSCESSIRVRSVRCVHNVFFDEQH